MTDEEGFTDQTETDPQSSGEEPGDDRDDDAADPIVAVLTDGQGLSVRNSPKQARPRKRPTKTMTVEPRPSEAATVAGLKGGLGGAELPQQ